jgi:hypothetical protein
MRIFRRLSCWCGRAIPEAHRITLSLFWDQGQDALMATHTLFMRDLHHRQIAETVLTLDLSFLFCAVLGLRVGSARDEQADEARTAFGLSSDAPCA